MYFEGVKTLEELKKAFIRLMKENHPDKGGKAEVCVAIQDEFAKVSEMLAAGISPESKEKELSEELMNVISALSGIVGIEIELCGTWLWISGNTKENRELLKALKCRWSPNKGQWYFREEKQGGRRWRKGSIDMEEIRFKYGSEKVHGERRQTLCA